ncbi:hypothetical protein [Leptodesmis sp.]|uniref:hypothetical protein n=1 Tax=Leptodesmis sp. TaxID=3100501 RepID=UPI0040534C40
MLMRIQAFSAIALQLPELERLPVLAEALEIARKIADDATRARALSEITAQLPESK